MMDIKQYGSAQAFRAALENRLIQISRKEDIDIMRLRRQFTFDRFLCRVFHGEKETVMLKGGYAMELRVSFARTTKDIDLCLRKGRGHKPSKASLLRFFQAKAALPMGDHIEFSVLGANLDLVNAPYGGYRFPVVAQMDNRLFLKFSIDVAVGDVWADDQENLHARNWLEFAGISSSAFLSITVEQQMAEKLHSYTMPRQTPNSRAKDLIDMILLIKNFKIDAKRMMDVLSLTFKLRKTHPIPETISKPPENWKDRFANLAQECGLDMDLAAGHAIVVSFWNSLDKD